MKKRTIYTLPKGQELDGVILAKLIENHKVDRKAFRKLESYVDDDPQMDREIPNELLTLHNFAEYITSVNTGYLLGNPVDYKSDKKIDSIIDNFSYQTIHELDSDLETDCSTFGQAFENIFMDEKSQVMSAKLSVYNTIVIYDDTFKHEKMYAIYYNHRYDNSGRLEQDRYDITIWTPEQILYRQLNKHTLIEDSANPDTAHFFRDVPVVHYFNNKRLKGDFESVISLIDAYNILQSDRVIDREKLVDAILAFYGAKLTVEEQKAIKDNRVVGLPPDSKAEYIVKNVNEADTDVLRNTIAADIHKFSMTPDLTDETFGDSPSGVSILYKLLAFEQNIKRKERQFEAALKTRFKLYATVLTTQSKMGAIDDNSVEVVFTRALPKNDFETSQMINHLDGTVDQETLVGQLSFVEDASEVVKKAREEESQRVRSDSFGTGDFRESE